MKDAIRYIMLITLLLSLGCGPTPDKLRITAGPQQLKCAEVGVYHIEAVMEDAKPISRNFSVRVDEDDVFDDELTSSVIISVDAHKKVGKGSFELECTRVGCYLAGETDSSEKEDTYEVHVECEDWTWFNETSDNYTIECIDSEESDPDDASDDAEE